MINSSRSNKLMILWHVAAIGLIAVLFAWWIRKAIAGSSSDDYPNRPIQIVVPYKAGGGSDTFVRIVSRGIVDDGLIDQPLVIVNQDGGIGTIGSREVKNAPPDGYKILCHHNAIITAKLTETVSYGPEAFEPIALTGEMSMVVLVRKDSPFENIVDLLRQAKATPREIRFGANKGAPAYFTTLQLEQAWPGASFNIVSAGGGADRYSKILGGHLEAGIFSLSEYLDFRSPDSTPADQDVRAIALLGKSRHPSVPEVPTAVELGVPVTLTNANYWWAPKGTPPAVIDKLTAILKSAMLNPMVRTELRRLRMEPTFDQGASFQRRIDETATQFEAVVAQKPTQLPDFVSYVSAVVAILLVCLVVESLRTPASSRGIEGDSTNAENETALGTDAVKPRPATALAALALLCGYVWMLGQERLPFAILTAAMVIAVGWVMDRGGQTRRFVLVEIALLTGLGTQFVFSEIFVTPLPSLTF